MSDARYAVGIDLGTTHCALSYVDLANSTGDEVTQALMPVPQLTAPGAVEENTRDHDRREHRRTVPQNRHRHPGAELR